MDRVEDFELNLLALATTEGMVPESEIFQKQFIPFAKILLLHHSPRRLSHFDLLEIKEFAGKSLDEILQYQCIQYAGNWPDANGDMQPVFFDLYEDFPIEPHYVCYDRFFAFLLRQTDLQVINRLLDYRLLKYHANDFVAFSHFLKVTIRKYKKKILSKQTVKTIKDWITSTEKKFGVAEGPAEEIKVRTKGRRNRTENDERTILSRDLTVLLIHFLRDTKVLLKDEGLTDADAAIAFELLTGYSKHTLRQELGKYRNLTTDSNLKKLHTALTQVANYVQQYPRIRV